MLVAAILGVILWYVAALLLAWLAPMGVLSGSARVWTYLLIFPGTLPFVLLMWRATGVARGQLGLAMAIGTTAAMFCDGVALAWFPGLYGGEANVAAAGAAILWGAAVGQVLGMAIAAGSARK
ncbi:hypothetical protein IP88_08660 [alpha proteobacterium AAP81b]|nr:hypothetical protein IP88_08660 [alpha proteobacterium AAP81b]